MKYVIPSYKRTETLLKKTIKLLNNYKIPDEDIYIFVAPEEYQLYLDAFPTYNVVQGRLGLCNQRNYITSYFEEGEELVCLDDDVEELLVLENGTLTSLVDLAGWVESVFELLRENQLSLWGIYPIKNPFFMKAGFSIDLKFCIGHCWGCINRRDVQLTLEYKEDFERTLKFYERDKGVLRMNSVCAKTKMGSTGGMDVRVKDRLEQNKASSETLIKLFPGLVRMNSRREGEILLKQITLPVLDGATSIDRQTKRNPRKAKERVRRVEDTRHNH
jgi:hypothetical protein